jgi:hypothetical protein
VRMETLTARGNGAQALRVYERQRLRDQLATPVPSCASYGYAYCAAELPAMAHGRNAGGFRLLHGSGSARG